MKNKPGLQKVTKETKRLGISDSEFESMKVTLNSAIHELVFAVQHMDNDEVESAQDSLVTASMNIEEVANKLASFAAGNTPD